MLSVGEMLSKERINKGLTLKQVEKETRIREVQLIAIEKNNWNGFSSKIYITGVIKNYARYLGLDAHKMIVFFRRDYEKKEEVKFKKRVSSQYFHPQTKRLAIAAVVIIAVFFICYFGYQIMLFLAPPKVTILSPKESSFKKVDHVKIEGVTEKDASVSIFGERIYQNKDGIFEYDFPLKQHINELTIEVVGANGKKTVVKKTFIHD